MAGLIKNQILKHLSKFTKNLSPDKISLSAMKGEGDLSNLELDEIVLTDLLALPGWICLTKATCNKVTIKIQWTKLNSQPICLYLDEVIVEMETCDVPRKSTSSTRVSSYNKGGKYGFAEQIIDGICLSINSIIVNFRSNRFNASIQIANIAVQSKTPKWQNGELFMTRLKNDLVGEVMIFKEAEWQTLRIEANALDPLLATTPLRLIANQSKIRITIKKKINDCSIVSSRLQVNLDDLLWVLTDSQLSAVMTFVSALHETITKSSDAALRPKAEDVTKSHASSSTTSISHHSSTSPQHSVQNTGRPAPSAPTKVGSKAQQQRAKIFDLYDITETSYHLYTGRIDLHLCDDVSPEENSYQRKVDGGAIQLVLYHLEFDIYPYHRAGESRVRWPKYEDSMRQRDVWATDLLNIFREDVKTVHEAFKASSGPKSGPGKVLSDGVVLRPTSDSRSTVQTDHHAYPKDGRMAHKPQQSELHESCIVVRVEDFVLFRVSTALDSKRSTPKKFLSSDKKQLLLPPEMPSVHVVFTEYYFPDGRDFPVPHPNLFVIVNPICLTVDYLTLLWMNTFSLNLAKKVVEIPKKTPSKLHTDICLEALMPRVILPQTDVTGMHGRPGDLDGLQLQMSKVIVTNCRLPDSQTSRANLRSVLKRFASSPIFLGNHVEFPCDENDCVPIAERFRNHSERIDDGYPNVSLERILRKRDAATLDRSEDLVGISDSIRDSATLSECVLSIDSFRLNMEKDVWCMWIDQVWLEFMVVQNPLGRIGRTLPLMESFPLTVWLYQFPPDSGSNQSIPPPAGSDRVLLPQGATEKTNSETSSVPSHADLYLLMNIDVKIQLQIDHERYSFLINLLETVARVSEEMEADFKNITGKMVTPQKVVLSAVVKEVEVSLLCLPTGGELSSQLTSPDGTRISSGPLSDAVQENTGSRLTLSEDGMFGTASKSLMHFEDLDPVAQKSIPSVTPLTEPADTRAFEDRGYPMEIGSDAMSLLEEEEENGPQLCIINGTASISLNGLRSQSPDSTLDSRNSSTLLRNFPRDSASFSGLKKAPEKLKSLNQAFSSLTSKLGGQRNSSRRSAPSSRADDSGLDVWDSLSMTSGSLSDEDDDVWQGFESQAELPAFEWKGMVQDECSIAEFESDDASSSFTARLIKKLVTVITVNIGNIEAVVQSQGKDMAAKASVGDFALTEGGNMEMEMFFQSVSLASKEFTKWPPRSSESHAIVTARFEIGRQAEKLEPAARERGFIQALVNGVKMKLHATTLKIIGDLFEDNKPSPPDFLMNATLSNIAVTLVDDKLPMYLAEPKNTSLDLFVHQTVVTRGKDGVFRVGESNSTPDVKSDPLLNELGKISSSYSTGRNLPEDFNIPDVVKTDRSTETDAKLPGKSSFESENDHLRRQLEKIGKMPCCRKECSDLQAKCKTLAMLEAENQEIRREMENQLTQLAILKEEREALLTVVSKLQDDLTYSERMRTRPMS